MSHNGILLGLTNTADNGTWLIIIEELRQNGWFPVLALFLQSEKWQKEVPLILATEDKVHPYVFVSETTQL